MTVKFFCQRCELGPFIVTFPDRDYTKWPFLICRGCGQAMPALAHENSDSEG